jgi:hypothetical protein
MVYQCRQRRHRRAGPIAAFIAHPRYGDPAWHAWRSFIDRPSIARRTRTAPPRRNRRLAGYNHHLPACGIRALEVTFHARHSGVIALPLKCGIFECKRLFSEARLDTPTVVVSTDWASALAFHRAELRSTCSFWRGALPPVCDRRLSVASGAALQALFHW